jgi:methylthioribose-1-phosphate isomerase
MVEPIKIKDKKVYVLDQKILPEIKWVEIKGFKDGFDAIKNMIVRGAPLIGITAFYSLALEVNRKNLKKSEILKKAELMRNSRPTAVNLDFAIDKFKEVVEENFSKSNFNETIFSSAVDFHRKESTATKKISRFGLKLFTKKSTVLTYCNAGSLATSGWGTALGVINYAFKKGKIKKVFTCETRPYLQGLRLTAFELQSEKIPFKVICDNTAGFLMKSGKIDAVIVGADRIALNGDTANKIGTYTLAVLAKENNIPFYVAAPTSTIDKNIKDGSFIPIEKRDGSEILENVKVKANLKGKDFCYFAFDVTPHNLIDAIITEKGIFQQKPLPSSQEGTKGRFPISSSPSSQEE